MDCSVETRQASIERSDVHHPLAQAFKRTCDVVFSAAGLMLFSPVLAAIALLVKLDSPGPVIFQHKRIGRGGVPFDMYKFRSMVTGGDDKEYMLYLARLIDSDHNGAKNGLPYRKLEDDPRVTRVGRVLRLLYLDELPQLWNVVKGDMSLVGPRPHVQFEVNHYAPHQQRRLLARPGCTGLWQVEGKADCSFDQLIDLDLEYIDRWSLLFDLKIVAKTALLMLRGGEAVWARRTKHLPSKRPPQRD